MAARGVPNLTGSLHHIGGQLRKDLAQTQAPSQEQTQEPAAEPAPEAPEPETKTRQLLSPEAEKAIRLRHEEFTRLRRDVKTRLVEQLSAIPVEVASLERRAESLKEAEAQFNALLAELDAIPDPLPESRCYQLELGDAMRAAEKSRLDFIMQLSKLERGNVSQGAVQGVAQGQSKVESLLPELNSLGRRQLFKFGFFLGLPLAVAIIVAGFLIGLAVVAAMRLGI